MSPTTRNSSLNLGGYQGADPRHEQTGLPKILSGHVNDPPARSGEAIQALPVTPQLAGLPMPRPFVFHRDPLREEGQVHAGHKSAPAIEDLVLRYRLEASQYQQDSEPSLLRRLRAPIRESCS